jgi:hypothetical protein
MKKNIVIILALIFNIISVQLVGAQAKKSGFDSNKITIGGAFGGGFSNNYSALTVAPQVGYRITPNFNAGLGIGYYYSSLKNNYSAHFLGLNAYARYYLLNYIVLQVQPELNRSWYSVYDYSGKKVTDTYLVPSVLVGGGLRYGNFHAMVLYDVVRNAHSPYSGIVYSVGVMF